MDFTMYDGQEVAPFVSISHVGFSQTKSYYEESFLQLESFRQQGGDTGGAAALSGSEQAEGAEETAGGDVDMS